METVLLKTCLKCNITKSLNEFGIDKYSKDGHHTRCLLCRREDSRRYRQTNTHKRRQYYQDNKARTNAQNQAYYYANKEKLRPARRAWEQAHRLERNARHWRVNLPDPEQARAKERAFYAKHRAALRAKNAAYYRAHPEQEHAKGAKRRARKAQAPRNDLTAAQWQAMQAAQKHRCYYCGKRCKGHLTQDHLTPLSKGGSHTVQNVIGVCASCNSRKGTKPPPVAVQPFLL